MHLLSFTYNTDNKHLTVTITEKATAQVIEITHYQDKGANGFDFTLLKSATDVQTWRTDEEPMIRLESLAAAARLAFINTLTETERFIIANSTINIEEDDIKWLFNDINKAYSIYSSDLIPLEPWIDLHSNEPVIQIMH